MGCRWTGHPWNCTADDPTLVYRGIVEGRSDYKKSFCDGVEMSLVVIRLGVTGLKKTGFVTSWTCLGEGRRRGGVI